MVLKRGSQVVGVVVVVVVGVGMRVLVVAMVGHLVGLFVILLKVYRGV